MQGAGIASLRPGSIPSPYSSPCPSPSATRARSGFGTPQNTPMRGAIDASLVQIGGPASAIETFRDLATKADRDPGAIPIIMFAWGPPNAQRFEQYRALGVHRVVLPPASMNTTDADRTLEYLDEAVPILGEFDDT